MSSAHIVYGGLNFMITWNGLFSIHCTFLLDYRDRVMSGLNEGVAAQACSILRSGEVEAVR